MGIRPWLAVVTSAITAISLAHVLYYTAIQRIGATIPVLVILSQPLLVLVGSSIFFDEHFTPGQLVCALMLLVGAGMSIWAQEDVRRKRLR